VTKKINETYQMHVKNHFSEDTLLQFEARSTRTDIFKPRLVLDINRDEEDISIWLTPEEAKELAIVVAYMAKVLEDADNDSV